MEKIKLYKKNLYKKNVSLFLAVSILLSLTALPSISFGASNTTSVFFSHTEKSENRLFIKTSYNDDTLTEAGVKELSDFKITADQLTSSDGADYEAAVAAKDKEAAAVALKDAISTIDKAATKGVYHKNNAARKVSRLAKAVNTLD